jgi:hypothetical protein
VAVEMSCEPARAARAMACGKVLGWGLAEGGAVRAAWASAALEALERRLTWWVVVSMSWDGLEVVVRGGRYLIANTLAQVLEALLHIRRVVVGLVGVLRSGREQLLVGSLEGVDAHFELEVVVRQLSLLGDAAGLLFDPLLTAGCEGRDLRGDLVGEGAELVHVEGWKRCCAGIGRVGFGFGGGHAVCRGFMRVSLVYS